MRPRESAGNRESDEVRVSVDEIVRRQPLNNLRSGTPKAGISTFPHVAVVNGYNDPRSKMVMDGTPAPLAAVFGGVSKDESGGAKRTSNASPKPAFMIVERERGLAVFAGVSDDDQLPEAV